MALKDLFKKKDETSSSGVTAADLAALTGKKAEEVKETATTTFKKAEATVAEAAKKTEEAAKAKAAEAKESINDTLQAAKAAREAEKAAAEKAAAEEAKKIEDLAKEVIRGDWGNGQERIDKLTAAGHDYKTVQAKVNELMAPKAAPAPSTGKTVEEVAKEVIQGKWGNGQERKDRLTAAGYDYSTVQAKVNELLK